MKTVELRVTGRVQGVGFRAWTKGRAEALGLNGWVQNAPDGSVLALLSGEPEAVDKMISALHDGPRWSNVQDVKPTPVAPFAGNGFIIKR